jgi:hypothetical protein
MACPLTWGFLMERVTVSSLRTSEWGLSRHGNTPAGMAGGCRGDHVPSLTLTAGLRVPMRDPCQRRLSGHGLAAPPEGCGP